MCNHKSLVAQYEELMAHYSASFHSITQELEIIKERFSIMMSRNERETPYQKEEIKELKWLQKIINSFTDTHYKRYHENAFDYLPSPIITAGAPEEFKFFKWGLIPYFYKDKAKAFDLRRHTVNCRSEEMYDESKSSYKDAAKNGQRCLIPLTGFFEWKWVDEKGDTKIPYYVTFKQGSIMSAAGLYSRWKNPTNGEYYYSYTVITTDANPLMKYVHNHGQRMPVFIPKEFEKDWLNRNLSKDDVLALCQPFQAEKMKANTISKLITTKAAETNVEDVLKPHQYEKVGSEEIITEL